MKPIVSFIIFNNLIEDSTLAIVIMLNNFFHDFAVAMLFTCLLILTYIYRASQRIDFLSQISFAEYLYRSLNKVIIGSWTFIIVGGIVRTIAYEQYEWSEAAGKGQITALVLKHILLISFVIGGTVLQIRLKKIFSGQKK